MKKLNVIDYFINFCCKVFLVIELLEECRNWCGWIPTCSHGIEIGCEIGGCDSSVLSVYVSKKSKRFILTKFGDKMFKNGNVFFWKLISYHKD